MCGPACALTLDFPAPATAVADRVQKNGSYFLPTSPFSEDAPFGVTAEGAIVQNSWKLPNSDFNTFQLIAPLRDQLAKAGYDVVFECEDQVCGGFDFRYQIDLLPEPDMHVNLGDYRYLTARRQGSDRDEFVGLIVSRSATTGFVHLAQIGAPSASVAITASTKAPPTITAPSIAGPVGERLETAGYATLDDLEFKTGSSDLSDGNFASLANLADYLSTRPDRTVVLVGHTDAEGSLDGNIALSKRRARAVVRHLIDALGVSPDQVSANGVGFLSPRASNLTDQGRNQNRRVEVILTSTQ